MADSSSTLADYVSIQENLIREASEALPHQFSQCTYALGPLRQAVYFCRDCPETRGICAACSVACHTDHDQIELFHKRNFRCDCPTSGMAHNCNLHHALEPSNASNRYDRNFQEKFCRCGRPYDAKKEREAMIQCLSCEDWFHESCCNLRERPSSREPTPTPTAAPPQSAPTETSVSNDHDDAASEASSSGLPPPLISADDYESFVCGPCVSKIPTLKRYAGTPGAMMVVRDEGVRPWTCVGLIADDGDAEKTTSVGGSSPVRTGTKRSRSPSAEKDGPDSKKPKVNDEHLCLAPPLNEEAQKILNHDNRLLGDGDVFLTDGFRERFCRCDTCLPSLMANNYLLEDEESYEPPKDPDSGLSLEQLGMRALARLPRDRAIDGIHAFNAMRDNLVNYLRPFADSGEEVKEADVRSFFEELQEKARKGQTAAH